MKLQGVVSLQGLEKLMQVLEKRAKDSNFIKVMLDLKENKITIRNYEQLKLSIDEKQMDRFIKDVFV